MKLEAIIRSEVSQKEKHQYSILMHIYEILKDGNNSPVCETAKKTQMYRTVFWTLWERVRVGGYGRMALKHKLSYVKPIASPGLMHDTGCSGLVHWDDPEGWGGEGGGRGFRMRNTCTPMVDSCKCKAKPIQYCKVKINK